MLLRCLKCPPDLIYTAYTHSLPHAHTHSHSLTRTHAHRVILKTLFMCIILVCLFYLTYNLIKNVNTYHSNLSKQALRSISFILCLHELHLTFLLSIFFFCSHLISLCVFFVVFLPSVNSLNLLDKRGILAETSSQRKNPCNKPHFQFSSIAVKLCHRFILPRQNT